MYTCILIHPDYKAEKCEACSFRLGEFNIKMSLATHFSYQGCAKIMAQNL